MPLLQIRGRFKKQATFNLEEQRVAARRQLSSRFCYG